MSAKEKAAPKFTEKASTARTPYRYLGCGLPNVFLVGVTVRTERETGEESVGIPCLPALLQALGKTVSEKKAPLKREELRFLRKRLGIASKDFAGFIGLSPEQYSRVENGSTLKPTVDKLVRMMYVTLASGAWEAAQDVARVKWHTALDHEQRIIATQTGDGWSIRLAA